MGNQSDRWVVPQARHVAAIEELKDASFLLDRSVGGLILATSPRTRTDEWQPRERPRSCLAQLVRQHPRVRLERFPFYARQLNPDEAVWTLAKPTWPGLPQGLDDSHGRRRPLY